MSILAFLLSLINFLFPSCSRSLLHSLVRIKIGERCHAQMKGLAKNKCEKENSNKLWSGIWKGRKQKRLIFYSLPLFLLVGCLEGMFVERMLSIRRSHFLSQTLSVKIYSLLSFCLGTREGNHSFYLFSLKKPWSLFVKSSRQTEGCEKRTATSYERSEYIVKSCMASWHPMFAKHIK